MMALRDAWVASVLALLYTALMLAVQLPVSDGMLCCHSKLRSILFAHCPCDSPACPDTSSAQILASKSELKHAPTAVAAVNMYEPRTL